MPAWEASGALWGACWAVLGASPEAAWAASGRFRRPPLPYRARWGGSAPELAVLGLPWGRLGGLLARLGSLWSGLEGILGRLWGCHGGRPSRVGPTSEACGAVLGVMGPQKRASKKASSNFDNIDSFASSRPSWSSSGRPVELGWVPLRPALVLSWALLGSFGLSVGCLEVLWAVRGPSWAVPRREAAEAPPPGARRGCTYSSSGTRNARYCR